MSARSTASFTVIGDTVNIASRLQDLTRELKTPLVVADAILRQIGGGQPPDPAALPIKLACQGERELRGRSARVRIWSPPTK
jgi:adenylate cyclase